jgi:hypothetical protein
MPRSRKLVNVVTNAVQEGFLIAQDTPGTQPTAPQSQTPSPAPVTQQTAPVAQPMPAPWYAPIIAEVRTYTLMGTVLYNRMGKLVLAQHADVSKRAKDEAERKAFIAGNRSELRTAGQKQGCNVDVSGMEKTAVLCNLCADAETLALNVVKALLPCVTYDVQTGTGKWVSDGYATLAKELIRDTLANRWDASVVRDKVQAYEKGQKTPDAERKERIAKARRALSALDEMEDSILSEALKEDMKLRLKLERYFKGNAVLAGTVPQNTPAPVQPPTPDVNAMMQALLSMMQGQKQAS